jgi:hypothetical protein
MTSLVQAQAPTLHDLGGNLPEAPEGARLIPLTKGLFAIVDDADFTALNEFKWNTQLTKRGGPYAYRFFRIKGTRRRGHEIMHRVISGAKPGEVVDHINGNGLDNRRANLRCCTIAGNSQNRGASLGREFKGVFRREGKVARPFRASINCENRKYHLGNYATEIEAARAYDCAAKQLHGPFARLNFPEVNVLALHGSNHDERSEAWEPGENPP